MSSQLGPRVNKKTKVDIRSNITFVINIMKWEDGKIIQTVLCDTRRAHIIIIIQQVVMNSTFCSFHYKSPYAAWLLLLVMEAWQSAHLIGCAYIEQQVYYMVVHIP